MSVRSRHRHYRHLHHFLVLLALLMATLVQPVLASVTEIHEVVHSMVGDSAHLQSMSTEASASPGGAIPGDDGSLLHALAAAGHCCGHVVAITSVTPRLLSPLPPATTAFATPVDPVGALIGSLFRPPIQA